MYEEPQLIKRQSCHNIEPSQLIFRANQFTGFYMVATLAFNENQIWFNRVNLERFIG